MSDKVSPATGRSVAGTAERGDKTSDNGARASSKDSGPAEPSGDSPAGGGSLASVLETLRNAASAHDEARARRLPGSGPRPGQRG